MTSQIQPPQEHVQCMSLVDQHWLGAQGDKCAAITLLSGGQNTNRNFKATSRKGSDFLLKICDSKTRPWVETWVLLLLTLRRHGIETCYPMRRGGPTAASAAPAASASDFIADFDGTPALLFDFLPGTSPETASPAMVEQLGAAMARLHGVPLGECPAGLPREFQLGVEQMAAFLAAELPAATGEAADAARRHSFVPLLTAEVRRLQQAFPADLPRVLCHGDSCLDNTVFGADDDGGGGGGGGGSSSGQRLLGLVDFEEACIESPLVDIGLSLASFCYQAPRPEAPVPALDEALCVAFLRGYRSQRRLAPREAALVGESVRLGLMAMAFWRFRQFHVRTVQPERAGHHAVMLDRWLAWDAARWQQIEAAMGLEADVRDGEADDRDTGGVAVC